MPWDFKVIPMLYKQKYFPMLQKQTIFNGGERRLDNICCEENQNPRIFNPQFKQGSNFLILV